MSNIYSSEKNMKILAISGKARHGKDYTASIIKEYLGEHDKSVLTIHYADLLKYLCTSLFNWDGKKDENGRHILQYVGTEVVRQKDPDFWVEFVVKILKLFEGQWDYVIIPDCRFPNEIELLKANFNDVVSLRVNRFGFESDLTKETKNHISETALDNYEFDEYLVNDGTELYTEIVKFYVDSII